MGPEERANTRLAELVGEREADIDERGAWEGITSLDARFMRVDVAAKDCGMGEQFKVMSKLLSKFVHPTALQILGVSDDVKTNAQRDMFFGMGCLFFTGAFSELENLR